MLIDLLKFDTNTKTHIPWRGKQYHEIVYNIADNYSHRWQLPLD